MKLVKTTNDNWIPSLIDEMFNNDFMGGSVRVPLDNLPSVNIMETDEKFGIDLRVPGYVKDNFSLEIDKDQLSISANPDFNEDDTIKLLRSEFKINAFKRVFKLPKSIDLEKIDAQYENGILSVHLLKKEEELPKPKRVIELK